MHSHWPWVITLAPGIIIAGLIAGSGHLTFGLGVFCGTAVTAVSQGVLVILVRGITTPGTWKRTVTVGVAHFGKYLLIGLAIYVAVHHPQIDSIGMFVGITVSVAGFVTGQVLANPASGPPQRDGD